MKRHSQTAHTLKSQIDFSMQSPTLYAQRFDKTIYEAAGRREIDATPLLSALESSRTLACGVASLLHVLRDNAVCVDNDEESRVIDHIRTDELLSLCIETMSLLNTKIEILADQLFVRHAEQPSVSAHA